MGKRETKERLVTAASEEPTATAWKIEITATAEASLKAVKDARVQRKLVETIDSLSIEPDRKGKALMGELLGFRSIRAVGQRYRIIYQLQDKVVTVTVVFLGMRKEGDQKDVYHLAKRLLGLLE